jgi:hypothetical protein
VLLDLLRSHQEAPQAYDEAEEVGIRRRLARVYTLLRNAAAKRRAQLRRARPTLTLPQIIRPSQAHPGRALHSSLGAADSA